MKINAAKALLLSIEINLRVSNSLLSDNKSINLKKKKEMIDLEGLGKEKVWYGKIKEKKVVQRIYEMGEAKGGKGRKKQRLSG